VPRGSAGSRIAADLDRAEETDSTTDHERTMSGNPVLRDIDYAAIAVKTAVVEKYGRTDSLENLHVVAKEATIALTDGEHAAGGTRDNLLIALRKSGSYRNFWDLAASSSPRPSETTTP
jgi:hypothetical protein